MINRFGGVMLAGTGGLRPKMGANGHLSAFPGGIRARTARQSATTRPTAATQAASTTPSASTADPNGVTMGANTYLVGEHGPETLHLQPDDEVLTRDEYARRHHARLERIAAAAGAWLRAWEDAQTSATATDGKTAKAFEASKQLAAAIRAKA